MNHDNLQITGCRADTNCGPNEVCVGEVCTSLDKRLQGCPPPMIPNGHFNRMDKAWNNEATFKCDHGYILKQPGVNKKVAFVETISKT